MNTIEQRITSVLQDDTIGPGEREEHAFRLLAREVSRLTEIVWLEEQVNANLNSRTVPDEGLYERLETLRRECGEGEAAKEDEPSIASLCTEFDEWRESMTDEQLANVLARWGYVPKAELDAANARIAELHRYNGGLGQESFEYQQRFHAAEKRIKELEARLAERNADAELGKAIRELRPKNGHLWAEARVRAGFDTPFLCRVSWRSETRDGVRNTFFHASLADAIAEYNERKD